MGWRPEHFWLLHESDTGSWRLFTTITEFLFSDSYLWNISLAKNTRVSMTIVNPADRWCKLNFGLLQGQVKLSHSSERVEVRRPYFYFLYIFLGIIGWKRYWATLLDTDLDSLLPYNYLTLLVTTLALGFSHTKHCLTKSIKKILV